MTRPAPAARPIARSAGESPTTMTRDGSVRSAWHTAKTASGAGFIGNPSSPQTIASTAARTPSARRVASVGARSSVVTTAMRRPPIADGVEQGGQVGQRPGQGDRIGHEPGRLGRPPRGGHARTPAPQDGRDDRPRCRPSWRWPAGRRPRPGPVDGSNPIAAKTSRATGRRAVASSRVPSSRAQPPHIAWKSMSVPSLSKMTTSIPVAGRLGEPPPATASPPRPPGRRCGPATASRPRTRHASGGKLSTHRRPRRRDREVRVVERVDEDGRRHPARRSCAPARPSPGTRRPPPSRAGG